MSAATMLLSTIRPLPARSPATSDPTAKARAAATITAG